MPMNVLQTTDAVKGRYGDTVKKRSGRRATAQVAFLAGGVAVGGSKFLSKKIRRGETEKR